MTAYFLSGLGVDSRIFNFLTLPTDIRKIFIDWLTPLKNESLHEYAFRISKYIDTSQPFVLIGLSFGGILATEVLQFIKPQQTILISSVTRKQELPFYYKLAGLLKIHYLLPGRAINRANFFTYWLFGIKEKREKYLLNKILNDTSTPFAKWAITEIFNWKSTVTPENVIRIHGGKDKILPIIGFKPDYLIPRAGHFMVVNRANQISKILNAILKQ